ncbi:MAG: hypothetical protein CMC55_06560 [Flavobacteriaceae bacterium]|nr:hypothetical protein [Flavobacteriaceae bacterium]
MNKLILIKYNKNKMGFFKSISHSFHTLEHKFEKGLDKGRKGVVKAEHKTVKFITHHPVETAIGAVALVAGAALIVGTAGFATPFVAEAEAATFAGLSGAVSVEAASEMAFVGVAEASEMGVIGADIGADVGFGAEVGASDFLAVPEVEPFLETSTLEEIEAIEPALDAPEYTNPELIEEDLGDMIDLDAPNDPLPPEVDELDTEIEQMMEEIQPDDPTLTLEEEAELLQEEAPTTRGLDLSEEGDIVDPDALVERSVQLDDPIELVNADAETQSVFQSVKEKIINAVRTNLPTTRKEFIEEVKNIIRQNVKLPDGKTALKWILGSAIVKSHLKRLEKKTGISTKVVVDHIEDVNSKIKDITYQIDKLKESYVDENKQELTNLEKLLEETKQFQEEIQSNINKEQHLDQKNTQLQEELGQEEQQIGQMKNEVEDMKDLIVESFLRPLDFSEMKLLMSDLESDEIVSFLARNREDFDKLSQNEKDEIINIGKKKMNL